MIIVGIHTYDDREWDDFISAAPLYHSLINKATNLYQFEKYQSFRANSYDVVVMLRFSFKLCFKLWALRKLDSILYVAYEPSVVEFVNHSKYLSKFSNIFGVIYTFDDEITSLKNIKKLVTTQEIKKIVPNLPTLADFNERGTVTQISSNKTSIMKSELYTERKKINKFFCSNLTEGYKFYGYGWSSKYSCYAGSVISKDEILKSHKFVICLENSSKTNGYISEKIYDCFKNLTIPIYMGAPNVADYIPADCFIDYRKHTPETLIKLIESMSFDDYLGYMKNITMFLNSETYKQMDYNRLSEDLFSEISTLSIKEKRDTLHPISLLFMIKLFTISTILKLINKLKLNFNNF
jgi:hypothetical protein